MTGEARVHLPNMHDIVPRPMPSKDEVAKMFQRSSQLQRVKERRFNEWFTTPLDGELWGAWGMKARPDKVGMTYMAVNKVSPAAEPADVGGARVVLTRYVKPDSRLSPEQEERVNPKYGGSRELDHKYDVWIDDAPQLAEEALERQWRPGRTLRWEEMRPLPPEIERAFDQFLTYIIQCQYLCSDILGPWIRLVHYNFPEVKSYLAYELFDYSLHCGMLRKRLLSNGGGMGVQVDGLDAGIREVVNEASQGFVGEVDRDFNAMVLAMDILFNGIVLEMMRLGEAASKSVFDQGLFKQMIQDNARHVSWGCKRIRYYLDHCPDREEAVIRLNGVADRIELSQTPTHLLNPQVIEPLAVLLGDGAATRDKGFDILRRFWPQIAENYLGRLTAVGLDRRDRCLIPSVAPF